MQEFRHVFPIDVRFRDIDALGHVNNAVYLTYLEAARIDYMRRVALGDPSRPLQDLGVILAEVTCTFRQPIFYGQRVEVGTRVAQMGRSSVQVQSRIEADGALAALARVVLVHYDYEAGRSTPIPDDVRARIARFEGLGEQGE